MADFRLAPPGSGSVIAVVATDAPLFPHQCQALARRVTAGLARTGTSGSPFSRDPFLAFSPPHPRPLPPRPPGPPPRTFVAREDLHPLYHARRPAAPRPPGEPGVNAQPATEHFPARAAHRPPPLPRAGAPALLAAAARLT